MHYQQERQCLLRLLTLLASADGRAVGEDILQEALTPHDRQELRCWLRRLTICASADGRAVGDSPEWVGTQAPEWVVPRRCMQVGRGRDEYSVEGKYQASPPRARPRGPPPPRARSAGGRQGPRARARGGTGGAAGPRAGRGARAPAKWAAGPVVQQQTLSVDIRRGPAAPGGGRRDRSSRRERRARLTDKPEAGGPDEKEGAPTPHHTPRPGRRRPAGTDGPTERARGPGGGKRCWPRCG